MKILCPIDFSKASVNAAKWALRFLQENGGGQLDIVHFIYLQRRAGMFVSLYDVIAEQSKKDLDLLQNELESMDHEIHISNMIYKSHPKEGIVALAKKKEFDTIIIGSSGLDALKNMTIGSVTEYVMNHYSIPIIVVPNSSKYQRLANISIGIDNHWISREEHIEFLKGLCVNHKSKVHMIHIIEKDESPTEFEFPESFESNNIPTTAKVLFIDENLKTTMANYSSSENINLLCMIHEKTNWIGRLFRKSDTKSKLYDLDIPLLILQSS